MQTISKNGGFISAAVSVRILQDQELVIRPLVPWLVMRIRWRHCYPQPPFGIKGYLHRIFKRRKFGFRGEQVNLETLGHGKPLQRLIYIQKFNGSFVI